MNLLGRRCRIARIATGFENAADFADAIGMQIARYAGIESGEAEPTVAEVALIAQVTSRSIDLLVTGRQATATAA